jgi:hypothetical protein
MGFDQQQNARSYRFEVTEEGQPTRRFTVKADLAVFLAQRVSIQEGPTLAACKLAAGLDTNFDGVYELTSEDLRSHVNARLIAEALRAEKRKQHPTPNKRSPWRNPICKGRAARPIPGTPVVPHAAQCFTHGGSNLAEN